MLTRFMARLSTGRGQPVSDDAGHQLRFDALLSGCLCTGVATDLVDLVPCFPGVFWSSVAHADPVHGTSVDGPWAARE